MDMNSGTMTFSREAMSYAPFKLMIELIYIREVLIDDTETSLGRVRLSRWVRDLGIRFFLL